MYYIVKYKIKEKRPFPQSGKKHIYTNLEQSYLKREKKGLAT